MQRFTQENPFLPNPNRIKELIEKQALENTEVIAQNKVLEKKLGTRNKVVPIRLKGVRYDG